MEYGVCLLSVVPLRAFPEHQSEMVSQLLFGDLFTVIDKRKDWYQVKMHQDHYQGWVAANQVQGLEESDFLAITANPGNVVAADLLQLLEDKSRGSSFPIGAGCSLPFYEKGKLSVAGKVYEYAGKVIEQAVPVSEGISQIALIFLNVPYLWGGRSAFGMDCSGFTQLVYKMAGLKIPRDSSIQATHGETIHLINEAQPGDLLFFDNQEEQINHVGILLNEGHIIHCHGKVRVDMIDHQGIYNRELKKYTHPLRLIKRIHPAL